MEIKDILHNVVCISNLSVRRIQITQQHQIDTRSASKFDSVLLVTTGTVRICIMEEDSFAEVTAPHMIVLEKDKVYTIEALEPYVELYDIGAYRHLNGDIVNPENLIRANYPFDPSKGLEEQ